MSVTLPIPKLDAEARSRRARVPLNKPSGPLWRMLTWYSNRAYGEVPDPGLAMAHNQRVLWADMLFERRVAKFHALDPQLKMLAVTATAAQVQCSWCLDFGYLEAHRQGLDLAKIAAVPHWRDSDRFDERERRVLAYAEAITATPPSVEDDLAAALRSDLGDAGLVELTMMIGVENLRSRVNSALGLASQGFSQSCRVPRKPPS